MGEFDDPVIVFIEPFPATTNLAIDLPSELLHPYDCWSNDPFGRAKCLRIDCLLCPPKD
jgi:hypothetical protein